jgi:hypothetical protein
MVHKLAGLKIFFPYFIHAGGCFRQPQPAEIILARAMGRVPSFLNNSGR